MSQKQKSVLRDVRKVRRSAWSEEIQNDISSELRFVDGSEFQKQGKRHIRLVRKFGVGDTSCEINRSLGDEYDSEEVFDLASDSLVLSSSDESYYLAPKMGGSTFTRVIYVNGDTTTTIKGACPLKENASP